LKTASHNLSVSRRTPCNGASTIELSSKSARPKRCCSTDAEKSFKLQGKPSLALGNNLFRSSKKTTRWLGFWCGLEAELQDTLQEKKGERQGSSKPSGETQQKHWWPVRQFDAESRGRGSHLGSTARLRSLVERPARQSEQATAVAEQPIKCHYGSTEIDTFSLHPKPSMLALRKGTPRLPKDQIRDASSQRGR
jgi:hypothetical protein